jgi:hypothetical protein
VHDLLGECTGLSDDELECQQTNAHNFYIGADDDGGYSCYDVPKIVFKYIDIWGDVRIVNSIYVSTTDVQRRAFNPTDLIKIENTMQLMMATSN